MKRILSIDGGGIRGIFSLQVLAKIEGHFRQRADRPDLVLADVIDFFAGTSTGAIIATCLSWGMSVRDIENLYIEHGSSMFSRSPWRLRLRAKYRADKIAEFFKRTFSETTGEPTLLGTDRLKTMLMVVMRNASTGSPWPITNNSIAMFNRADREDCNLNIPLWQLLRASTAAPTYFTPEKITIGNESFMFVDGGITPYNNPSLLAVLMATLPPYNLGWPTGRDRLHVISVGTGGTRSLLGGTRPEKINIFRQIGFVPTALLGSVSEQQDMLCRVLGSCVHGAEIDREVGHLHGPGLLGHDEKKFTYVRYNKRLDIADDASLLSPLLKARLDDLKLIPDLQALGKDYATRHVLAEHLDPA